MTSTTRREMREAARNMSLIEIIPMNLLVPQYLIHCAAYYKLGFSIIPDDRFDKLSKRIDKNWDRIKHRHKNLIDRKALGSGGHYIDLPLIAVNVASAFQWALEDSGIYVTRNEKEKVKKTTPVKKEIDMNFFKRKNLAEKTLDMGFFKRKK